MKKITVLIAGIMAPVLMQAQQIRNGDNITITQPVFEDLYITGGTATINAPIHGDLIIGAGTIILNDTVSGDVLAGGGKITVNGYIGDNLRAGGGEIYINGLIQGDLAVSGGTVTMGGNSIIQGSALLGAGTAVIGGKISKSLKCRATTIRFSGEVGQDADCRGSSLLIDGTVNGKSVLAAPKIEIGNRAAFFNDVAFWQKNPALDFKNTIRSGDALYEPTLEINNGKWQYLGFASALFLLWYIAAAFVFILLIQYLFGRMMSKAAEEAFSRTAQSLGYGFLFLAVIPVAAFILMLTLIGLPLGILVMMAYGVILVLATLISAVVIANRINRRGGRPLGIWMTSLIALAIFIALKMLTLIPFLGWLVMLVVACLALGSIVANLYKNRGKRIIPVS